MHKFIILLIASVTLSAFALSQYYKQPDYTTYFSGDNIEYLGNPFVKRWRYSENRYARNIWDMQLYQGRIYLGSGNMDNSPPAPNTGATDIWAYDPSIKNFVKEGQVDEESIERFRVIDGELFIPGSDAMESWDFGNLYRKTPTHWKKYRNISNAIHVNDIINYQGQWFSSLGIHDLYSGIAVSDQYSGAWKTQQVGFFRFFDFFKWKGRLYASGLFFNEAYTKKLQHRWNEHQALIPYSLYQYQNNEWKAQETVFKQWFPQWSKSSAYLKHPTIFNDQFIYIAEFFEQQYQESSWQLYATKTLGQSNAIHLPYNAQAHDIKVQNNNIYVLASHQTGKKPWPYSNLVLHSTNLTDWRIISQFKANTFARSFERLNHCFYIGMGTDVRHGKEWWKQWDMSPLSGSVLRTCS